MENSKDVKRLEVGLAFFLMFIPLINFLIDGFWRESISNYAYSNYTPLLPFELGVAGALFIYNGLGYKRHWYNVILGLSLWGVALTPHLDYSFPHFTCAGIFFLGSILSIGLSSNIVFRNFKFLISGIIVLGLLLHFIFNLFNLLIAEWLGIVPIATHFIIKSINTNN